MAMDLMEAKEEYEAVRKAYLNALSCQEYSLSTGGSSRMKRNHFINQLRDQMDACAKEVNKYSRGGIKMSSGEPSW